MHLRHKGKRYRGIARPQSGNGDGGADTQGKNLNVN